MIARPLGFPLPTEPSDRPFNDQRGAEREREPFAPMANAKPGPRLCGGAHGDESGGVASANAGIIVPRLLLTKFWAPVRLQGRRCVAKANPAATSIARVSHRACAAQHTPDRHDVFSTLWAPKSVQVGRFCCTAPFRSQLRNQIASASAIAPPARSSAYGLWSNERVP